MLSFLPLFELHVTLDLSLDSLYRCDICLSQFPNQVFQSDVCSVSHVQVVTVQKHAYVATELLMRQAGYTIFQASRWNKILLFCLFPWKLKFLGFVVSAFNFLAFGGCTFSLPQILKMEDLILYHFFHVYMLKKGKPQDLVV